jgi:hypothetical protein
LTWEEFWFLTPREVMDQWEGLTWRLQFYGMGFAKEGED